MFMQLHNLSPHLIIFFFFLWIYFCCFRCCFFVVLCIFHLVCDFIHFRCVFFMRWRWWKSKQCKSSKNQIQTNPYTFTMVAYRSTTMFASIFVFFDFWCTGWLVILLLSWFFTDAVTTLFVICRRECVCALVFVWVGEKAIQFTQKNYSKRQKLCCFALNTMMQWKYFAVHCVLCTMYTIQLPSTKKFINLYIFIFARLFSVRKYVRKLRLSAIFYYLLWLSALCIKCEPNSVLVNYFSVRQRNGNHLKQHLAFLSCINICM